MVQKDSWDSLTGEEGIVTEIVICPICGLKQWHRDGTNCKGCGYGL